MGSAGVRHVASLRRLLPSEASIVAVRRRQSGPSPDCDVTVFSIAEALDRAPSLAVVSGPASTHIDDATALVLGNVPVLVEKPLCVSVAQAEPLLEAHASTGTPVMVGYNLRHAAAIEKARTALQAGRVGRPLVLSLEVGQALRQWRPGTDSRTSVTARAALGGGVLLELSHELDLALHLAGPAKVVGSHVGQICPDAYDVEDCADVLLRHDSGCRTTVHLDMVAIPARRRLVLSGDAATLVVDLVQSTVTFGDSRGWEPPEKVSPVSASYDAQTASFLRLCGGVSGPGATMEDGLAVLRLVEAARAETL